MATAQEQRNQQPRTLLQKLAESATRALGRWRDPWFDPKYMPIIQNQAQNPAINTQGPNASKMLKELEAKSNLLREKLFTTFQGGALRFLPMDDGVTDETPEMRSEYLRIFLKEPAVKSAMMSKVIAVVSSKMSMIPASEDELDKRISKWTNNILTRQKGGIRKMGENILLFALNNGHSLNEKIYEIKKNKEYADLFPHGYIGLKQLKIKKPEDYRLEVDQFRNIRGVWSNRAARRFDPSYFVISPFMPMYENPAGTSDLRAAIRAYNLILLAQQLRAIWTEQFSMPIMEGTYPKDNEDAKAFVEAAIQQVRALGWYVVPEGVVIKAIDVSTRGQSEFQQMIDDLRKEIYLCIVGSYLQAIEGDTQGGAGNSETHRSQFELFQWYLCEWLAEQINEQIIPDLVGLNFSGVEPPRVSFAGVNDGDLLQGISVYQALKTLGIDLSKKAIRQKFEVDPPEDDMDKLAAEQPQPPGMGSMFGGGAQPPNEEGKAPDPLAALKLSETDSQRFSDGPQILYQAMKMLGAARLSDVALAREMQVGDDGLTDYGTMMRTAKYHGVEYQDIKTPSIFDFESDGVILTTMEGDDSPRFVLVSDCDLEGGTMKITTATSQEDIDPETFLGKWPGGGARRIVAMTVKPKEGETPAEPSKHSEDDEETDEETARSTTKAGVSARKPVHEDDFPAGPDGRDVYKLLNESTEYGSDVVTDMARVAAGRMVKTGNTEEFFNAEELETLATALEDCLAPADLLGRSSVLLRHAKARALSESGDEARIGKFSEQPCGLPQKFATARISPMKPANALDYFKSLIPSMNLNVTTWGNSLRRRTFTMAEASNKIILKKVKKAIEKRVAAGDTITGAEAISDILSRAGIHPKNPQYPAMVFRTNYMEMFNVAAEEQRLDPDIVDDFPVWRYMGIRDGRQGKDHEVHFDKYYPSKAKFKEVRGERLFNCRCQPVPVYKAEWAKLKAHGAKVAKFSEGPKHKRETEALTGGLADNKPDDAFDPIALKQGMKVEMEHTLDKEKAKEIAKDHLVEDPKYYGKLKIVEMFKEDAQGHEHKGKGPGGGQFTGKGGGGSGASAQKTSQHHPVKGIASKPANQADLLKKVSKEAMDRDLYDAMRANNGVNMHFDHKKLAPQIARQFDAHGADMKGMAHILNNGIDPNRTFHTETLGTQDSSAGLLRDHSNFLLLGHPGRSIKQGGVGGVIVDEMHAPNIPELKAAFPGVAFVPASKAAELLPKVAAIDNPKNMPVKYDDSSNQLNADDHSAEAEDMPSEELPVEPVQLAEEHEYCSTQFTLPHVIALKVMGMADRIKDEDLADKGREDEPHITVLYGIHDPSCQEAIADILRNTKPVEVTLRRSSVFEKEDCDVIKLNVDSPELHRLRDSIDSCCDNTQEYAYYQPHVTLAYVKKGKGKEYSGLLDLEGTKVKLTNFSFRMPDETGVQMRMGMSPNQFDEIYHGPKPPSDHGWQEMQPGPRGGKRWRKSDRGGKAKPKEKGGDDKKETMAPKGASIKLKKSSERAWEGKPQRVKTPLPKMQTGAIGEAIATGYLQQAGVSDVKPLGLTKEEKSFDMVSVKHGLLIECKAGWAGASSGAMQWRLTIGQPGEQETAWLAKASKEEKAKHNEWKMKQIELRKKQMAAKYSKQYGKKFSIIKITCIVNPDTQKADVYKFDGLHRRIGWTSDFAKKGYKGSFDYEQRT